MESAIAWALEDKLGYWIKSFSREQLSIRGRTARLSNVEIDGDALHAGLGLPPALAVATARIQELVITLPSILNMQVEPTVVDIDKLEIILEEKGEMEHHASPNSDLPLPSSTKDSGPAYADKIVDGMTVKVGIMNLLIKSHGISPCEGGITGSTPLGAITVHDLTLYTTNEKWQVVSLKEAMNFSDGRELIYVFKKMEWQSLTIDLKPHVNNIADIQIISSIGQYNTQDDGGAIIMPFVGDRVFEGKSGEANITIQKTEQKNLLGLEFQVHIIEVLSPGLSEHGLLTLISFITSLSAAVSRRVADPEQKHLEAARSLSLSIMVDHVHFCIKDIELQLELLMKSFFFSRASIPDGDNCKILSCIKVGELVLRDTFIESLCTLIEPSKQVVRRESSPVPEFGQSFCSIYPFGNQLLDSTNGFPLLSVYSLQITPSPLPPKFSVETVITCNPLTVNFQEQSCLRIASILANEVVKNGSGTVSPDSAIHSLTFSVQQFDFSASLTPEEISKWYRPENNSSQSFSIARLRVENLYFCLSPSVNCTRLSLEKESACSLLWEHQPVHASKRKWVTRASYVTLETFTTLEEQEMVNKGSGNRLKCIMIEHPVFEVAMATADGFPLSHVLPLEGVVRIGIHFHHYIFSIMAEELFFLLALCSYFGQLLEQILSANRSSSSETSRESSAEKLAKGWPSDTVMNFSLDHLDFYILESSPVYSRVSRLAHLGGSFLFLKVSHHTLGSTLVFTTSLQWKEASAQCFNLESPNDHVGGIGSVGGYDIFTEEDELPMKKPMFWVHSQSNYQDNQDQFLDIIISYVTPCRAQDVECCKLKFAAKISGGRLGGGMSYTESVLQRLGIEPDGCPGKGLLKGIINSFSGPLAKLLILKSFTDKDDGSSKEDGKSEFGMGMPYSVDVSVELRDWILALEGTEEIGDWASRRTGNRIPREVKFWQAAIRNLHLRGKRSGRTKLNSADKASQKTEYPFEHFTARAEGLQAIRPHLRNPVTGSGTAQGHQAGSAKDSSDQGTDLEATMVTSQDNNGVSKWTVDTSRFSVEDLVIGAAATKEEQEYLSTLCRSEADSLGRIAAAVLCLLELDGSLGQAAIDQLGSLGSAPDGIFTTEKLSAK